MESLILAVGVVFPIIVYMVIGWGIRKMGYMKRDDFQTLNLVVFRIFIPLTLFLNISNADLKTAILPDVFGLIIAAIIIIYLVVWVLTDHWIKDRADGSSMIQGIFRSNFVLFGNTMAVSLCQSVQDQALVSALSAVVVPLFNALAVLLFELRRGGRVKPLTLVGNIFRNPLVDAGILGCLFNAAGLEIPGLLEEPLTVMAGMATPLALIMLGGLLSFGSIVKHAKYLVVATTARLIVIPVVMLGFFIILGYRGNVLVAVLAVFASPTAVASAPMSQSMGGNGDLSGEIVASTSVYCIFTIFLFVLFLSGMGYIES